VMLTEVVCLMTRRIPDLPFARSSCDLAARLTRETSPVALRHRLAAILPLQSRLRRAFRRPGHLA
jgi:hypothetical protein